MADTPESNGRQSSTSRTRGEVDLLQRSFRHVEDLLNRLEFGSAVNDLPSPATHNGHAAAVGSGADLLTQAGENAVATPIPEALSIVRDAEIEANRIRAEAADIRDQAIAEAERLLLETRDLGKQLQAEARRRTRNLRRQARLAEAHLRASVEEATSRAVADAQDQAAKLRVAGPAPTWAPSTRPAPDLLVMPGADPTAMTQDMLLRVGADVSETLGTLRELLAAMDFTFASLENRQVMRRTRRRRNSRFPTVWW